MSRSERPTRKGQLAATKEELLSAGVRVVARRPVGDVMSGIRASDVAGEAGRTTGAFYNLWPSQEAYREDLLAYLFAPERWSEHDSTMREIRDYLEAEPRPTLNELVRRAANANWDSASANPTVALQVALEASMTGTAREAEPADAGVRNIIKAFNEELNAAWEARYELLLGSLGYELVPPMDAKRLALATQALADGLYVRRATTAGLEGEDGADGLRWTPLAVAVHALISGCVRPADLWSWLPIAADPAPAGATRDAGQGADQDGPVLTRDFQYVGRDDAARLLGRAPELNDPAPLLTVSASPDASADGTSVLALKLGRLDPETAPATVRLTLGGSPVAVILVSDRDPDEPALTGSVRARMPADGLRSLPQPTIEAVER